MSSRVAVLTAMVQEMRPLVDPLHLRPLDSSPSCFAGHWHDVEVVTAVTGMGDACARRTLTELLDCYPVDEVVMVGIAGSVDHHLGIGELVHPDVVVDHDTGEEHRPTSGLGHPRRGKLLTTQRLLNQPEQLDELRAAGVVAVDMETVVVGQVCTERGIAWSVFRAISDRAGDPATDPDVLSLANADGSADIGAAVRFVARHPQRIPHLARLGRGTRRATQTAAQTAVSYLSER